MIASWILALVRGGSVDPDPVPSPSGVQIHVEITPLPCPGGCPPVIPGGSHGAELPLWLQVMLTSIGVMIVIITAWRRRH